MFLYSSHYGFRNFLYIWYMVEISQTVAKYGDFSIFPRWRPSAILDLLCEWLDHPWRVFDGLYHCAKFGWNQCGSFDNMQVLVFWLWLENAYSRPPFFWGGAWEHILPPKKNVTHHPNPQKTVLGRNHVIWAIKRKYRSGGSSWALEREKKDRTRKKSQKGYI